MKSVLLVLLLVVGIFQVHCQTDENEESEDLHIEGSADGFDDIEIISDDEDLERSMSGSGENEILDEPMDKKPSLDDEDKTTNEILEIDPVDLVSPSSEPTNPDSNSSFWRNSAFVAAIIIGGSLGLLLACCVFLLVVYRLRKKDQGSYPIDDKKPTGGGYQYTAGQEYFA